MDKQEIKEQGEALLEEIAPDRNELINRRINHINFARTIIWLCINSRTEDFIYNPELSKYLGVSTVRIQHILGDLTNIGLLKKRFPTSTLVEYWFEKENGEPIVLQYFERAKKTLGIKFKLTTVKKEE